MKMLIDAKSDRIVGFPMLGVAADEVLAVVQTAMLGGLPYTALRDAIFHSSDNVRRAQRPVDQRPYIRCVRSAARAALKAATKSEVAVELGIDVRWRMVVSGLCGAIPCQEAG